MSIFIAVDDTNGQIVHKQQMVVGSTADEAAIFPTQLPQVGNTVLFVVAVDYYFDSTVVPPENSVTESILPASMTTAFEQAGAKCSIVAYYKTVEASDDFSVLLSKWAEDDFISAVYLEILGDYTLDVSANTDSSGTLVSTLSTGTTGTLTEAGELGLSFFFNDSVYNIDGARTWTNSYEEIYYYVSTVNIGTSDIGSAPGFSIAKRIIPDTTTQSSTFSYAAGAADQAQAFILVFRET